MAFPSQKGSGTQMTLEIAKEQNVECVVDESWELQD